MAWNKLAYVKTTPLTALPKVASGSNDVKIWEAPTSPGDWQFSDTKIVYNGITFGNSARVPVGPGGEEATFNMVLSCTGADKDNYFLEQPAGAYGSLAFDESNDLYIALVDITVPEAGLTNAKVVLFCGGLRNNAGQEAFDDIKYGLENLQGFGVTPTVNEIYALFPAAIKPDGTTEDVYGSVYSNNVLDGWDNEGGPTGYEQVDKTYFGGGSDPMLDLRIDDAAAIIGGAVLNIGEDPSMPLMTITGGNNYYGIDYGVGGDDLSSLKTKLIDILTAATGPGEPLEGKLSLISPSGDNLPDWVQIHLEGLSTVWFSQDTIGYESLAVAPAETHLSGGSDPMLDLRIDDAEAVKGGGKLIIGTDGGGDLLTITGGQNQYGFDYGVDPGDDLTDLKGQLVNILNAAMAGGEPLNGVLTMASPSSDNLPDWVQIHLEGVDETVYVYSEPASGSATEFDIDRILDGVNTAWRRIYGTSTGGAGGDTITYNNLTDSDELVNEPWIVEFNFDVSNSIPTTPFNIGAFDTPFGFYRVLGIEGVTNVGPGIVISVGLNGAAREVYAVGGDWRDGPATSAVQLTAETGRIKIEHDGSQNYTYSVSYDTGPDYTWTELFAATGSDPSVTVPTYQTDMKQIKFQANATTIGDTLDVRIANVSFLVERNERVFLSLQSGDVVTGNNGYIQDRLGFTDGVNNYIGTGGSGGGSYDGHNIAIFDSSLIVESIANDGYLATRIDTPLVPMFDGVSDIYGLTCEFDFGGGLEHFLFVATQSELPAVKSELEGMGVTVDEEIGRIFTANGTGEDYTWSWTPPTPPVPPTPSGNIAARLQDINGIDEELNTDVYEDIIQ